MHNCWNREINVSNFVTKSNSNYFIFRNVVDKIIFFLLIMKNVNVLHKWIMYNKFDKNVKFETSFNDYNNDEFALKWINHFIEHIEKKRKNKWILFIVNDFEFHMTHEFFVLIDIHDIKLFKFFVHFTHFIQSLNVEMFQSYKQIHENVIDKIIRNDDSKFIRLKFLIVLTLFRFFAFIKKTIKNVWRRIDIYFFNFDIVLNFIRNRIFERTNVEIARFNTFFMQNFEFLNKISRESTRMRKIFRFLNHFHQKHELYNINSLHTKRIRNFFKKNSFENWQQCNLSSHITIAIMNRFSLLLQRWIALILLYNFE